MYNQDVMPLAAGPFVDRRTRMAWALCGLFPAIFLLHLFALALLSAPAHDDFCFACLYARSGFVQTISIFHHTQSGRILALWPTQVRPAIATATNIGLLSAHSLTMAVSAGPFLFATAPAAAIAIGWVIVVSAGGNSTRMEQLPNGGHVISSLFQWMPSLLMTVDVTASADRLPNDCIASYYHESAIYAADPPR